MRRKKNDYIERENWKAIDSILAKEFHLKPWELDELTIPETSFYLLALREKEDEQQKVTAGMDPGLARFLLSQQEEVIQKKIAYVNLPPEEKLSLAYKGVYHG